MKFFLAIVALAATATAVLGQGRTWSAQEVNAERARHLSEYTRISKERLGQHGGDVSGPYMAALSEALGRSGLNIPDGYYDNRQHGGHYSAPAVPQGHAHQVSAPVHHGEHQSSAPVHHYGHHFQGNQRQWTYADLEKERSAHLQEHARQYQAALQAASQANSHNPGGHQDDGSYDPARYEKEGQY